MEMLKLEPLFLHKIGPWLESPTVFSSRPISRHLLDDASRLNQCFLIASLFRPLLISQQRRPLAVLANDLSTREWIAAEQSRYTDRKRKNKEDAADGERKDPLQL